MKVKQANINTSTIVSANSTPSSTIKSSKASKTSNWSLLQSKLSKRKKPLPVKTPRANPTELQSDDESATSSVHSSSSEDRVEREEEEEEQSEEEKVDNPTTDPRSSNGQSKHSQLRILEKNMRKKVVGLDCEMVGLGHNGKTSALARCSIVSFDGDVLYDKVVRPKGFVTDFRTKWSGIKKSDLRKERENVVTFEECQESVAKLLKDKILVGHALQNDLDVLLLSHPRSKIRDTSRYQPYMRQRGPMGKFKPRSLKELTAEFLGKKIQTGEHDSVEDARCAVSLYRREMERWEQGLVEQRRQRIEKGKSNQKSHATRSTNATTNTRETKEGLDEEVHEREGEDHVAEVKSDESKPVATTAAMEISQEELHPQRKRKLSIKFQQSEQSSSTLISQLIQETKKVDGFVSHQNALDGSTVKEHRRAKRKEKRKREEDVDVEEIEREDEEADLHADSGEVGGGVVVFEEEGKKNQGGAKNKNSNKSNKSSKGNKSGQNKNKKKDRKGAKV